MRWRLEFDANTITLWKESQLLSVSPSLTKYLSLTKDHQDQFNLALYAFPLAYKHNEQLTAIERANIVLTHFTGTDESNLHNVLNQFAKNELNAPCSFMFNSNGSLINAKEEEDIYFTAPINFQ